MNFQTFLTKTPDLAAFTTRSVIQFKGEKQYPLLFFSLLFELYKRSTSLPIVAIDVATADAATVQAQLETSFLGMQTIYWLHSLSELDDKKCMWWANYLYEYKGPNKIIFFTDATFTAAIPATILSVELPDVVDQKIVVGLMNFFSMGSSQGGASLIKHLFAKHEKISLDTACVVMNYARLMGASSQDFNESWLNSIVSPEQSLFVLSTHFFAKNGRTFFSQWVTVKDAYPDVFWVSYWSEQVWRAANYLVLMQQQQPAEAKKIGYRLPFSFLQKDWKSFTAQELINAHDFLNGLDNSLKNGGTVPGLELFYVKFLNSVFKQ